MLPLEIPSTTIPVSVTTAPHLIPNLCWKVKVCDGKYGKGELQFSLRHSSTSTLDAREWSVSRPAAIRPFKAPPSPPND